MNRQIAASQARQQTLTTSPLNSSILQRQCNSCGQKTIVGGECGKCQKKKSLLQRRASSQAEVSEVPAIVHEVLNSSGKPLDATTRTFMESRFGHDFSSVRVHTDVHAAKSAQAVNALAYTVGRDVVFGAGQYAPGTYAGKGLLAHELTHVVQQGMVAQMQTMALEMDTPGDAYEQEAEKVAQELIAIDNPVWHKTRIKSLAENPHSLDTFPSNNADSRCMEGGEPQHRQSMITPASGVRRLHRAVFRVGSLPIHINYGNLVTIPVTDYQSAIEIRFTSWTGSPAATIHSALSGLTPNVLEWVLFGIDLLVDNTTAAHNSFNRVQGVQRLIARAPSSSYRPLGNTRTDFEQEVLQVSGWFEVALAAGLADPVGANLTTIRGLYNPPPGPSAPLTGTLDVARLNSELPPALTALLRTVDPANWAVTGTQPLLTLQTIADQIQAQALIFFSPFADTAVSNAFSRGWRYSANLFSVTTMIPTQAQRIGYLLNRAEIAGRRTSPSGSIFSNVNFDSARPADQSALLSIVTTMEIDPVIQAIVNRLLQHTGRTNRATNQVGVSTEFDSARNTECEARWQTIDTLTHELVHVLVHPNFPNTATSISFGQIVREGFTEVLGVQMYASMRDKANSNAGFKAQMEAGITSAPCPPPAPASIDYGQAGTSAERIRSLVGNNNFRSAYFLGAVHLVGL
jgi:Domain of unknown function (DUF4157)